MARNTRAKKQPEAHKIDGVEIFAALRELEKTQGIPMDYMLERLKQALANAYRKDREDHRDVPAENVVVDISEQGITMDYMLERLKQALANAYRKDREDHRDVPAENVVVDISEQGITMFQVKTVVEELEDTALEIHIDTARNTHPNVQIGGKVETQRN